MRHYKVSLHDRELLDIEVETEWELENEILQLCLAGTIGYGKDVAELRVERIVDPVFTV